MNLRYFGAAGLLLSLTVPSMAEDPTASPEWQNIYRNDFSDTHFAIGVSRNRYCVEQAFEKAKEIREKGGTVGSLIHLQEAVQLVATTVDNKQLVIACSATGSLAIFYKAPASLGPIFDAMSTMKSEPEPVVQPANTGASADPSKAEPVNTAPAQ